MLRIPHRLFTDRHAAGIELAARLAPYARRHDVVVLGLPRGGVPVAYEVARALAAPLDVFLVRKLGVPWQPELAMGAIASGDVRVLNEDLVRNLRVAAAAVEEATKREQLEFARRESLYRQNRPPIVVAHRVAILVDDGLATGSTMTAAVQALRQRGPSRAVVAVPVGAATSCRELSRIADEVVCARMPDAFSAVGEWYRDFSQTTDDEVCALLR